MNPTRDPVWEDLGDEFYNCPFKFITDDIVLWWEEYSYYKSFSGTAPSFEKVSVRFLEACQYYERELIRFKAIQRPKGQQDLSSFKVEDYQDG